MSDLISLKITIEHDANYLLFGDRICREIKDLDAFCQNRYQDLHKNFTDFRYYWVDDDGDEIRITTDEDYQSFLQAMTNAKARLYVIGKNTMLGETGIKEGSTVHTEPDDAPLQNDATSDDISARPVHQHTICDVCDEQIVGHRYKCLTCHDYDLCMTCEAKFRHKDHLMLRIPKPALVNRSQSTVSRMLDKLRVYSARITSNVEKDGGLDAETNAPAGNESAETNGTKRGNARSVHRSKHSEERHTHETSKPCRGGKSCGNDRKQGSSAAAETASERSLKETKEKPSIPTESEMAQRYRDMLHHIMYLNSTASMDSFVGSAPWSTSDHVSVANVAAASAAAAAARANALANKVMKANIATKNGKPNPSQGTAQPSQQSMEQMLRQTQTPKQQKPATTEQQPSLPPPASLMPLPFLPFVNLTWPTQEKLMVASESVSKLLDPLGLSFEIRHKSSAPPSSSPGCAKAPCGEDGAVPSTSTAAAETTTPIPATPTVEPSVQQQEKTAETKVPVSETSNIVHSLAVSVCEESKEDTGAETEMASGDDKGELPKAEKGISTMLESDSVREKKPHADAENEMDDEDDSQNTSSASLLTDDDQDLLEVAEDGENVAAPSKPPVPKEKSWTLIDLPQEQDEERIANAPLDAIAKLIGRDLSPPDMEPIQPKTLSSSSKEKKKDKTAEEKQKDSKKSAAYGKSEREYEYEMFRKIISEQNENSDHGMEVDKQQLPPKEVKPLPTTSPNSGPSSSSSSGSCGRSVKSSRKSSSAQQKDSTVYSRRPHVNHAIHTMMTMGFSNHNGWLTQLLESLNGDIPKALDLLLQHRH